ncbi:putative Ig domain-containing protein [Photobacterium damselae subsp. damselae]|uniref:putative Ig domain-containing protein n=4 Tax=Photobacterium damselae TaxID=38293 RepID=UPI001F30DC43|nr:putative Ig domain-containing protein [Photobacterium damselae]UKA05067.1 putative Ig domain-containing protein [Photobacterium damselae subsp. damselae]UKA20173.1 putative Ig domain-containing protein [Photobacterium damselae subsp. damselae]
MILKKTLLSSFILLSLSACHDNGGDTSTNEIQKPSPENPQDNNDKDSVIDLTPVKPIFNATTSISGTTGQAIHGKISATDKKNLPLLYTMSGNPAWLHINAQTGELSGTPGRNDNGDFVITVTASNGKATNSVKVKVNISDSNHAPQVAPVARQIVIINSSFSVPIIAKDSDGDTLTYRLINGPSWAKINPKTGVITGKGAVLGQHPLNVQVSDGKAVSSVAVVIDIVVNPTPVVTIPNTLTAQTRYPFVTKIIAKDPNGKVLHYSIAGQPSWLHLDSKTGVLSGTPGLNDEGLHEIEITVSNGKEIVVKHIKLSISDSNHIPTIAAISNQKVIAGQLLFVAVMAQDKDHDALTYTLINAPTWMSINSKTGAVTGHPTKNDLGSQAIVVKVSDGKAEAEIHFSVEVIIDPIPVFSGSTSFSAKTRQDFFGLVSAKDPNGKPLTYHLVGAPSWLHIDPVTGQLSGQPPIDGAGDFVFSVSATNGTQAQTQQVSIHVTDSNKGATIEAISKQTVIKGNAFRYAVKASDPEGDTLTYRLQNAPAWLTINGDGVIEADAKSEELGLYTVQIVVNDGRLDKVLNFQLDIVVDPVPTINSNNFIAQTRQAFHGQIIATDPNKKALTYTLSGAPSWLVLDPKTGQLSGQPSIDDAGTTKFTVTVTNGNQEAKQEFTLTVEDVNTAPVFESIPPQSVIIDQTLTFVVKATDKDKDPVTYGLKNAPSWLQIDPKSGAITGTPSTNDKGNITITITASDGHKEASTSVLIHVVVDPTPVITTTGEMQGTTGKAFNNKVVATDPNNKDLTYSISGNPSWLQLNPNNGVLSGTPGRDDSGDITVTITVSNGEQQSSSTIKIQILDGNKAPVWRNINAETMTAGNSMNFTVKANDENQDPLTYSLQNAPSWLSINSQTGVITARPEITVSGDFSATLIASDGKLSATTTLTIHIEKGQFEVTTSHSGLGEITPEKMTVKAGEGGTFTIGFDSHNKLKSISGCDGQLVENKYTIDNIHADCQINVAFDDVGYIPPEAFNTNDFPSDLAGNLEATVLFAQNHIVPAQNHKEDITHLHKPAGEEVTHKWQDSTQHLIGERTTLLMFKPKAPNFNEAVPVTMIAYDADGNKLGQVNLERPYKLGRVSGVNPDAVLDNVDFNIDPSTLADIDTNKVATESEAGQSTYLNEQIIASEKGVVLHSTPWLRLHYLLLDFNPKFDGKYLVVKADSPNTTDVTYADGISKGDRNAYMGINIGQVVTFYNIKGHWYTAGDLDISKVTYGHGYWSTTLPAEWLHYGLKLSFEHDGMSGELANIDVGAPTVVYMNTIDIGMLTKRQDSMEFAKDPQLPWEFFQTLPTSRLVVSRYQGMTFDEIMMPNGQLYTDHSSGTGGWQEGDMRSDIAKSLISIGIDSANFGINASDGPGQNPHSDLALMLTVHTSIGKYTNGVQGHGGSGGGGIVTLTGTVGNEMSHEAGHGIELGHSEGYDMSIHHPADQQDSTWGWDSKKNVFIPNFYKTVSNQERCIGDAKKGEEVICVKPWHGHTFGTDAMYGGEGSMYPDNRYTMYTPYSSTKMQRVLEKRMVFSESSPTGYLKWNNDTHKMEPFSYPLQIKDILTANIGSLSQDDGVEYLTGLFHKSNIVDITTGNGNWMKDIPIPDPTVVPTGSVLRLQSWAGYNSYFTIAGKEITLSYGAKKIYRSNGSIWQEIDSVETSVKKKPEKFGVPVATLLGYYDPEEKMQSYIYPTFHGSRGYTYGDDQDYITPTSCHLDVALESGQTKQYWLPSSRLSSNFMNKFHVNIAESDNPTTVSVICHGKTLVTKEVSKPQPGLIQTVSGAPLSKTIS